MATTCIVGKGAAGRNKDDTWHRRSCGKWSKNYFGEKHCRFGEKFGEKRCRFGEKFGEKQDDYRCNKAEFDNNSSRNCHTAWHIVTHS